MRYIVLVITLLIAMSATAQTDWKKIDRLIDDGSYKTAYAEAEKVLGSQAPSAERLKAAWYMAKAAAMFQEEAYDSAKLRYETLLPTLTPLDQALCLSFLGRYDEALRHEALLKNTPVEQVKEYATGGNTLNVTPTVYDMVVVVMQEQGDLSAQERLDWQRKLADFHAGDADDIRIWHDLRLYDYDRSVPNKALQCGDLRHYVAKYRGTQSPYYTRFYAMLANECNGKGEYVQALRYCDTAVQLAPKSEGGIECANLRMEITRVRIDVDNTHLTVAPGRQSLQRITYRNTDHLWLRIVPYVEAFSYNQKAKEKMLNAKPLEQWDVSVPGNKEYREESALLALPSMKAGHYILLVSPTADFKQQGCMAYEMNCTDMLLVQNGQEGLLLDRATGKPIVGQPLRVQRRTDQVLGTATTDRDGRYRFNINDDRWGLRLVAERDGYTLNTSFNRSSESQVNNQKLRVEVRTDRPIYKPGEEVQVAVLCYTGDGLEAQVVPGRELHLEFQDPNWQEVSRDTVMTDDFGVATARFTIPTDRLAGDYQLIVGAEEQSLATKNIRVEEYKQPKFMVSMETAQGEAPQFGKPYTVRGMAASYSGVPVSSARVQYTIERRRLSRWWWRWWGYEDGSTVAEGELTTAADGSFEITFTPEPDSNIDLSHKPTFEYVVSVDVTDLNGESHPAQTSMRVGYRTAFLSLEGGEEVSTLDGLKTKYIDINGNPLPGQVDIKIERLWQPAVPLLDAPAMRWDDHNTLDEKAFNTAFPLYAYSKRYNDRDQWAVASQGWKGESGVYRITLTAEGADTAVEYRTVTTPDARKVQSQKLLWVDEGRKSVEVGETYRLRFGSRFKEVEVFYLLRVGNEEREFKRLKVNDELMEITIPVDKSMLGGFQVDLLAVREGIVERFSKRIDVPFSHKKLDVEIHTFRDKLLPGEQEEWTISVKSAEVGVRSAVVMTMFDDALNSYERQQWGFSPWRSNSSRGFSITMNGGTEIGMWLLNPKNEYYRGSQPTVWNLVDALPHYNRWGRGRIMYKSAARSASKNVMYEVAVTEEAETEQVFTVVEDAAPAMMNAVTDMADEAMPTASMGADRGVAEPVQARTNLNTLAFFAADVRTGEDGTATYKFIVPELLTRWNVQGMAFTKDIKIGTLDKTLVTQKPLMVQPNLPRFLRHGDSLALMAKVVKESSEFEVRSSDVAVSFLLTDAATGEVICNQTQHVQVKDAAQVMFDVEVPRHVYVATYRIVAQAEGMSDGEQGQIPVVSNRQAVTVSQALYINGVGEKRFALKDWTAPSTTREPHLLAAEVVSNPIWLAIKAMPYLQELESPSNLYLANRLYVNTLGLKVLQHVNLSDFAALEEGQEVRLKMNEDVKQTLLQATPWVRDAQGEEAQREAMAAYFDKKALQASLDKSLRQLQEQQQGDGGWSWMPNGESSSWITQQILKKLTVVSGQLTEVKERALKYVDREEQRYYDRWIKPNLKKGIDCQPTNIDYLYMRSFYGKGTTEAYKYYYANALKRYKDYEHLSTQAQLALIFHRAGDKKQARDLIRRLKEKSLTSDEMGTYWRDNRSSWWWYQRPIETQALLIQAFSEVTPQDVVFIGQMQQWLLKQKQTTHWGNDEATVKAIDALMVTTGTESISETGETSLTVCGMPMTAEAKGLEGYRQQRWSGEELESVRALRNNEIVISKQTKGIAWGGVYYQFTDDMDKVPTSETGITLKRTYTNASRPGQPLRVGDRMKVRVDISCDRHMEYLELIDGRPSCVEPLSTEAGWRWNDGLRYYITVNNTDTRCYVDRLEKGRYWFEYEVYITNPGTFLSGPITMQCMYAPEFRAIAPAQKMKVE